MSALNTRPDAFPKPRGFVEIRKWLGNPDCGILVDTIYEGQTELNENLVVSLARAIMSRMLSGAGQYEYDPDDGNPPYMLNPTIELSDATHPYYPSVEITDVNQLFITKMMWGKGTTDPSPGDEQLEDPIADPAYKVVSYQYPSNTSVQNIGVLETTEANGEPITEIGLFTQNFDLLVARKTFPVLTKSDEFSFEFLHTIVF